jgi:hypothetical protein
VEFEIEQMGGELKRLENDDWSVELIETMLFAGSASLFI